MSRIGKKPIKLEAKVTVNVDGRQVTVSGPKGTLTWALPDGVAVTVDNGAALVEQQAETAELSARRGLVRSILQGQVEGVLNGYRKALEIQGIGYRGQLAGQILKLQLGYSHDVEFTIPAGVKVTMADATHITVEGPDKQLVGQTAATIRRFRPPDSYKGKGVRYVGERVVLKEGKTVG